MNETQEPNRAAGYSQYLLRRSCLAKAYRRYFLYPKIASYLRGAVLDVGCGIGDFLRYRPGVTGLDIDPENVAYCRSLGLNAQAYDGRLFPFQEASFEGVVLDNVLEHLLDPSEMLAQIYRVLKRGGTFVVGVPGKRGFERDPDHKIFYDENALTALMKGHHFERKALFYRPVPFFSEGMSAAIRQQCCYGVFLKVGHPGSE